MHFYPIDGAVRAWLPPAPFAEFLPSVARAANTQPPLLPSPFPQRKPHPSSKTMGGKPVLGDPMLGLLQQGFAQACTHKHATTGSVFQPGCFAVPQFTVCSCPCSAVLPSSSFFFYLTTSHKSEIPFRPGKVAVTFLKRNETRPAVSTLVITCYRVAPIKHLGPHLSFLPLPVGISGSSSPWLTHRIIMIQIALL